MVIIGTKTFPLLNISMISSSFPKSNHRLCRLISLELPKPPHVAPHQPFLIRFNMFIYRHSPIPNDNRTLFSNKEHTVASMSIDMKEKSKNLYSYLPKNINCKKNPQKEKKRQTKLREKLKVHLHENQCKGRSKQTPKWVSQRRGADSKQTALATYVLAESSNTANAIRIHTACLVLMGLTVLL